MPKKAEFLKKMSFILGDEFKSFEKEIESPAFKGVRINTLKSKGETVRELQINQKTPFCEEGYYISSDEKFGNHPLHHAGAFYIQEPSATSAVTALDVQKGDIVLDLCAAPGGKSTQAAARLQGEGLIWSNEIVFSRAKILVSNFERMGIKNGVITSLRPDVLCEALPAFFDKIIVDAPCSGEGMIRKERTILDTWSEENVEACAIRQQKILDSAAISLKPGGYLCYSTCTFSPEENEQTIEAFLKERPDFSVCEIKAEFGRPAFTSVCSVKEIEKARRVFYSDGGEGHFVCLLKKRGDTPCDTVTRDYKTSPVFESFWKENFEGEAPENTEIINNNVYIVPAYPKIKGITPIRAGVLAGEIKGSRFEPSHALFSAFGESAVRKLDLKSESDEIKKFLHGETLNVEIENGYTAVLTEGVPLSFGKVSGGILKNHYPKGLRTY